MRKSFCNDAYDVWYFTPAGVSFTVSQSRTTLSRPLTSQTELGVMSFSPTLIWFVSKSSDIYNIPPLQTTELLLLKLKVGVGEKNRSSGSARHFFFLRPSGKLVLATLDALFYNHHFCTNLFKYLSRYF